jgi:preprotein translocase subunit SecG
MENVVLTIHLILALLLIGVVLLQRNEGGSLLSGGGAMTARGAANALTRLTWIFAGCFIATSITLTVLAARNAEGGSVVDLPAASETAPAPATTPETPPAPSGDLLPPPSGGTTTGTAAPATTAPATPDPATAAPATGSTTTGTTGGTTTTP